MPSATVAPNTAAIPWHSAFDVGLIGDVGQAGKQYQGFAGFVKTGTSTWELTAASSADVTYNIPVTIQQGTLVVGPTSVVQGELISNLLGGENVSVLGGTLRTTSFRTGKAVLIDVGGDYTQGPGGTLALGLGGRPIVEDDHMHVGGSITLGGTLDIYSLNGFRPVSGDSFTLIEGGPRLHDSKFGMVDDTFNNNDTLERIDIYAKNGFGILYLKEPTEGGAENNGESGSGEGGTGETRENTLAIVTTELLLPGPGPIPDSLLLAILNPTAEELTAMFQIPFSNAFAQSLNLNDRMMQIRQGQPDLSRRSLRLRPRPPSARRRLAKKRLSLQPWYLAQPTAGVCG